MLIHHFTSRLLDKAAGRIHVLLQWYSGAQNTLVQCFARTDHGDIGRLHGNCWYEAPSATWLDMGTVAHAVRCFCAVRLQCAQF
jgi:hypothetical protein